MPTTQMRKELEEKLGAAALGQRLKAKMAEYHGLLTNDAAAYLVSLEEFGHRIRTATLMQAKNGAPCRLRVRLERVFPPKTYERAGGFSSTQRALVSDQSGSGTLVAYDAACDALQNECIAGDMVEAEPVRYRGGECHVGGNGSVSLVEKGLRAKLLGSEGIGNFEGRVGEFFGDSKYRKKGGAEKGLMSSFSMTDGKNTVRVVCWDSTGLAGILENGSEVTIENGTRRGGEIHVGGAGRLLVKKGGAQKAALPKIDEVKIDAVKKTATIVCEGKDFLVFDFDTACGHFRLLPLPEGVSAETALELKKAQLVGKSVPEQWVGKG